MSVWLEPQPIDVPQRLRDAVGGHPLVAETLARRGILDPDQARVFLNPDLYAPAPASELPDLEVAAERLRRAIHQGEQVIIWGDFDADGMTSAALLFETLRQLEANVAFYIPSRHQGHGLHRPDLDRLIEAGAGLILTCDTGVTALAEVAFANSRGAEVIVTDHHVPGDKLPPALAVVNTHRLSPSHPKATLPGVGVAHELARALDPAGALAALDLVAVGTVADVATLTGDTRYYVQQGLAALRGTARLGLRAMYEAAGLRPEGITEEHLSFVLAPRLNSFGRLADATRGVELLITDDAVRARTLAMEVEGLNARRRWLTKQVTDAALSQVERDPSLSEGHQVLVLSQPAWPPGVIGVVAGRLAERFGMPAVLIATPPGETARGSGRSIPGVDLIAALTECASLLEGYGGHAGAAGFGIDPERIPDLRASLSRAITAQVGTLPEQSLSIDAIVELPDLTFGLVNELRRLAPFGPGNPRPKLAVRDLHISSETIIGRTAEHRRITVQDQSGRTQPVFWWHGEDWALPQGRFDLALGLSTSDYRGLTEVQVEWIDAREREPVVMRPRTAPGVEVRDYRAVNNPEAELRRLMSKSEVQVWAEGADLPLPEVRERAELERGPSLALWTLPPGPRELRAALARVKPDRVFFFGQDPGLDSPAVFLKRLTGLVKFALRSKGGNLDLNAAAAACSQQADTIEAGLGWLEAKGWVRVLKRDQRSWQLASGTGPPDAGAMEGAHARLETLLAETAAYREYLLHAPASALVGRDLQGEKRDGQRQR